jgi:hypothetical protein
MSNLLGLEEERRGTGEYDDVVVGPDPEAAARARRGANWFYWVAGLSVINSLAFYRVCSHLDTAATGDRVSVGPAFASQGRVCGCREAAFSHVVLGVVRPIRGYAGRFNVLPFRYWKSVETP